MRRLPEAYHIDITILNKKSRVACFKVFSSRLFSSLSPRFLSLALLYFTFIYLFFFFWSFSLFLNSCSAIATIYSLPLFVCRARDDGNSAPIEENERVEKFFFSFFSTFSTLQKFRKQAFVSTFRCTLTSIVFMCMRINVSIKKEEKLRRAVSLYIYIYIYSIFIRKFHAKKTHFFFLFFFCDL